MFDAKDLVSAKEARELSETSLSSEALYELEQVNERIQAAINNGYYGCWYYRYLPDQAVKKLKTLGYKVSNQSNQREGDCFKIEW